MFTSENSWRFPPYEYDGENILLEIRRQHTRKACLTRVSLQTIKVVVVVNCLRSSCIDHLEHQKVRDCLLG